MKSLPKFLAGAFRIVLFTALEEAMLGGDAGDEVRQIRGWKLLLLLPRLLLSKSQRRDHRQRQIGEKISDVCEWVARVVLIWRPVRRRVGQCERVTDSEAKRGERAPQKDFGTPKSAGRWSEETRDFLNQFARGKVRHEPAVLKRRVQQAWRMGCQAILSCSAAKAFAVLEPVSACVIVVRGETDFFSLPFK